MIIGSIKENLSLEKRVSITPETAKSIINLGLKKRQRRKDKRGIIWYV